MPTITGFAKLSSGAIYPSATFTFTRSPRAVVAQSSAVVTPGHVTVTSGAAGDVEFDLLAGSYTGEESATGIKFSFLVPDEDALFQDCLSAATILPWPDAVQAAIDARDAAIAAATTNNLVKPFATRAEAVTYIAANTFVSGAIVKAVGIEYKFIGYVTTAIPDMAGFLPNGEIYVDHWAENVTPSSTNMTAAFLAAVAYIKTTATAYRAKQALNLFGSEYMIDDQILIDFDFFTLRGDAMRGSMIRVMGDFGDVLKFQKADTTALINTLAIADVSFRSFEIKTSGAALAMYGCQGVTLTNFAVDDFFGGILVQGGSNQWWNGVTVHGVRQTYKAADMTGSYYVKFEEGVTTTLYSPQNIYMQGLNCEFNDAGTETVENGIVINCCDGLWFTGGHSQGVTSADILIEPVVTARSASGSQITSIISNGFWTDSQSNYGIRFRGNSINNNGHVFSGHRWLTNRVYGVWIEPSCNVGNVTFDGGQMLKSGLSGMRIEDGYSVVVNGITFEGCGSSLGAERYGIHLAGTARNVNVGNCIFTNTVGPNEVTSNTGVGVYVANGTVDKITVTDCHFEGMVGSWDIEDNQTGVRKTYRNNTTSRTPANVTASGTSLTINAIRDYFIVASSVAVIGNLTHRHRDRVVTLEFSADCVVHNTAPFLYTRDGRHAYFSAGHTITLRYTGSYWVEVARSNSAYSSDLTIRDTGDGTKAAQFSVAGVTTGTTRTLTVPNASGTLAILSGIGQTFGNSVNFDNAVSFANTVLGDATASRIGYKTGAGAVITQLTSKSTGVSIPYPTGNIVTHNAALAAGASVIFEVTCTACAANDIVLVSIQGPDNSGGAASSNYSASVAYTAAGAFGLRVTNDGDLSGSEAVTINFAIFKGSNN